MLRLRLCAIPLLLSLSFLSGPTPQEPTPAVTSQRMERVGQLGGLASAVTTDGVTALLAEGDSLLRLDVSGRGEEPPPVIAETALRRGAIQALAEAFPMTYVLTEEGLVVMQGVHGAPLPQAVAFVPGGGQAMAIGPGAVYVAARQAGLRVIDVSLPQQARVLTDLPLPGQAQDVAFSSGSGLAFVAAGEAGLHVVGAQNPAQPVLLHTLDTLAPAQAVAVANSALGPLVYAGSGGRVYALALPDTSRPGEAQILGEYAPLRDGRSMALSPQGDFGYVAGGEGGLEIYDLSVPSQALQIYGDPPAQARGPALDVAVSPQGDLLLVAAGEVGLRIVDVSNPYGPVDRFAVALPGSAEGVAFSRDGRWAFVALGAGGLGVVDVTTAAVLNVVSLEGRAGAVVAGEGRVYVALGEAGLAVVRFDRSGREAKVTTLELPGQALALALRGDTLFVATGRAGLLAVDVLRPAEPRLVGQLAPDPQGGRYLDVGVAGKRAFVADGQGLAVVDVADPARMVHLTRREGGAPRSLALARASGGLDLYLYLLSEAQIASYEVSVSTEPVPLGVYRPIERVGRIVPHGDWLLLTNAGEGPQVVVLNVSNPRLPREVGWYGEAGHSLDAAAHDERVLVAGGPEGLALLAFGEDDRLGALSAYNPLPGLTRVVSEGRYVLAGGGRGWSLVDAGDPANLRPLGRAGAGLRVRALAGEGAQVVAGGGHKLASFDVSDPLAPRLTSEREIGGLAKGVALDGRYVFVADGAGGLEIFTRSDLRPVTRVALPAGANGVAFDPVSRRAYLPLDDGSLALVDVTEPTGGLRSLGTLVLGAPASLFAAPQEGQALALAGRELSLLDVSGPGELALLERGFLRRVGGRMALDGERLAVLSAGGEVDVYAFEGVEGVSPVETLAADTLAMAGYGGTLYLARGEAGLAALPLTDGTLSVIDGSQPVYALLLDGETLYAAGERLASYELSGAEAAAPRRVAEAALSGPAHDVALAGVGSDGTRWLYVSTVNGIDVVRQPGADGALEMVRQVAIPSGVGQVVGGGNRAYAAPLSSEGGLLVLSTADLARPEPLFTYRSSMGATVREMLPLGERLLVSWEGGLELLDVGNPASPPALLAVLPTGGGQALDVTLAEGRAYVSVGQDGVAVVDVSRPAEARVLGAFDTPGVASHAAASGGTLFVADGPCGLRVVDVSNPRLPQERGFWLTSFTGDVALSPAGDVVYAANGSALLALRYLPDAPPAPPPMPRDPFPPDGEADVPTTVSLEWGPPPDPCDPLRYEVWLGVGPSPPLLGQVAGEPGLDPGGLRGLATYHWRVRAIDSQGDMADGPLWSFTTRRGGAGAFVVPAGPPIFLDQLRAAGWMPLALAAISALGLLALLRGRRG